jgi:acetyl/propionyl-CoA carboxylase alpha subunit
VLIDPKTREKLFKAAKDLGMASKYRSVGTVEFLVDVSGDDQN